MEAISIISWIILSIIIGAVGANRKIGFAGAFFLSLLLSPLIGIIFTVVSKSKETEKYEKEILSVQISQKKAIEELKENNVGNIADDLIKIKKLLDEGIINIEEYENLKMKALNGINAINEKTITPKAHTTEELIIPKYTETVTEYDHSAFGGPQLRFLIDFKDEINGYIYQKKEKENLYRIQCNKMSVYYKNKEAAIKALYTFNVSSKILNTDRTYI